MGRSHESMTRREILKRGAIVGGGVLWVTPVVQTLGMGPAFASQVSGDTDRCSMEVTAAACLVLQQSSIKFTFSTVIPAGCACNPLPNGHQIVITTRYPNHSGVTNREMFTSDGVHYERTTNVRLGDIMTVRCLDSPFASTANEVAESKVPLVITTALVDAIC